MIDYGNQKSSEETGGWMDGKSILRIAYSNQTRRNKPDIRTFSERRTQT